MTKLLSRKATCRNMTVSPQKISVFPIARNFLGNYRHVLSFCHGLDGFGILCKRVPAARSGSWGRLGGEI